MMKTPDRDPYSGQYLESVVRLEAYLDIVNELLPNATPIGAYCMALSGPCVASANPRVWPTRELLLALSSCGTIKDGMQVMEEWVIRARPQSGTVS